jgi:uncharacterized membrane protein YgcG
MKRIVPVLCIALLLASCATTTLDPNYAAQIEAYASVERAKVEALKEQSRANEARFTALAEIAKTGDANTRALAVMALAFGNSTGNVILPQQAQPVPVPPESQADKAYKWTALFAGPVTNIASAWFGYSLGKTQSNNNANTTIASYNAFQGISANGMNALTALGLEGFASNASIAARIQAPQPNISIGGDGVIGNGTFTGPNSGQNSGNSGLIRVTSPNNCTSGNSTGGSGTGGNGTTNPGGGSAGSGSSGGITGC